MVKDGYLTGSTGPLVLDGGPMEPRGLGVYFLVQFR